jgi:hypothetical protein
MAVPGRGIWVALGAAAVGGLIFGMLLGVLNPDEPTRSDTGASGGTSPASAASSGSVEPTGTPPVESDCEDRPNDDFGFLNDVTEEGGTTVLEFDRAQLFTGAEATREAERRGNEIETDYYIANDNKRERERSVGEDVTASGSVLLTQSTGPTELSPQTVYEFVRAHPGQLPVYLRYDPASCDVIKIEEVFFP